ncbi:hypothetical protein Pth03_80020 [Planotetraspora thailandica]|uniref:YncI copper-binding domain-containing protein n=1 Tax=Planotetraspora thailandica TaxID=487172 RepID=A0A8J3Y2B9_9ACTN|nr:DUF1775 domain-containing protein [Planotetraspora thailandica]GII59613.1 hypothetical protein Pth03_80020 [Planotetraspora thailandica]
MRSLQKVCGVTAIMLAVGTIEAYVRMCAAKAVTEAARGTGFRVPSEKEMATTIRVQVRIPAGVTVTSVDPKPGGAVQQDYDQVVWS